MVRLLFAAAFAFALAEQLEAAETNGVDVIFSKVNNATPGCAIGIEHAGQMPQLRAFGQADLEHHAPIRINTVFEAGSVSKQFTAASILMLADERRLSLSDDIRRFIPELPSYGDEITVAQLIAHTSGLRDWGEIAEMSGWPRSERVYSASDVLAITVRQRALNFEPGTAWSYTNTGYNLLAMIVERVTGEPFEAFTRRRLFIPLGMTHTSWRGNFRLVVNDRAIAYRPIPGGFEQLMPFENAVGHGGLLTTVGDLLIWNRALSHGKLGNFVTNEIQREAMLKSGDPVAYAGGLFLNRYHGWREISHDGSTAGYRAWIGRYPEKGLSIAFLCNTTHPPDKLAHRLADLALGMAASKPSPHSSGLAGQQWLGWWVNDRDGVPIHIKANGESIQTDDGVPVTDAREEGFNLGSLAFSKRADGRIQQTGAGQILTYSPSNAFAPSEELLKRLVGFYTSDEIGMRFRVSLNAGKLEMTAIDRPDSAAILKPAYQDSFLYGQTVIRPVLGPDSSVIALRFSQDRVWDLRVTKTRETEVSEPLRAPPSTAAH